MLQEGLETIWPQATTEITEGRDHVPAEAGIKT